MSKEIYTLMGFDPKKRKTWSIKGSWQDIRDKMDSEQKARKKKIDRLAKEYRQGYKLMIFSLLVGLLYMNACGVLGAV